MKFGIGQAVKRVEDRVLITGTGKFTDDIDVGEGLSAHFLRSAHAHAIVSSIDFKTASKLPGVHLIATQFELDHEKVGEIKCLDWVKNADGSDVVPTTRSPMARGIVRSVGDIIAMVVATTKEQALNAAELIEVNYEPLPAITDVDSALEADAPQLYPDYPGNKVFHWRVGNHEKALRV